MERLFQSVRMMIFLGLVAALVGLTGCASTPTDRISRNRALFETFPPDVQEKVLQGQIEEGFTQEMVLLALGEPSERSRGSGVDSGLEVWTYREGSASPVRLSVGIGTAVGVGRRSTVGTGVGVGTTRGGGGQVTEQLIFRDGILENVRFGEWE